MWLFSFFAHIMLAAGHGIFSPSDTYQHPKNEYNVPSFSDIPLNLKIPYEHAYMDESANWLGNTTTDPFYQSPSNISSYIAGDVIRFDKITPDGLKQYKDLPGGISVYRMLYQSSDPNNNSVPASAFILLPYARSKWYDPINVIVWAHGTSGIERQCAPSNQRDLYYEYEAPYAMALHGYAVIAPDYAGLGSDTTFHYLNGPSHAADVAYSVIAARKAFRQKEFPRDLISYEWVVVGHSEGGLVAWATNERERIYPTGGFLGAVSIAPALQNLHIIRWGVAHNLTAKSLFYSSYTLSTIARYNTSVDVTKYFSDVGLERTQLANTACYDTAAAVFKNLSFPDIYKDQSWLNSRWAVGWEDSTGVSGNKSLAEPILLIVAESDLAAYPEMSVNVFVNHCQKHPGTRAHLSRYPGMDHDPVAFVSQLEYFDWINDRFQGVYVPQGCIDSTVDMVWSDG